MFGVFSAYIFGETHQLHQLHLAQVILPALGAEFATPAFLLKPGHIGLWVFLPMDPMLQLG